MKRIEKISNLVLDIYRELFKQSEPTGDFDELVKNATINDRGEKEIPFMDYYISQSKMDDITTDMMSKKSCGMVLKPYEKKGIRFEVYLGCSPRTKHD